MDEFFVYLKVTLSCSKLLVFSSDNLLVYPCINNGNQFSVGHHGRIIIPVDWHLMIFKLSLPIKLNGWKHKTLHFLGNVEYVHYVKIFPRIISFQLCLSRMQVNQCLEWSIFFFFFICYFLEQVSWKLLFCFATEWPWYKTSYTELLFSGIPSAEIQNFPFMQNSQHL